MLSSSGAVRKRGAGGLHDATAAHAMSVISHKNEMLREFRDQEARHRQELRRMKAAIKSEMAEVARNLMDVPGIDADAFASEMAEMQALLEYESSGLGVERKTRGARSGISQRDEKVRCGRISPLVLMGRFQDALEVGREGGMSEGCLGFAGPAPQGHLL